MTVEKPQLSLTPAAPSDRLFSASFLGLLFTQLLTAVNDNTFRWLVIGIGKGYVEDSQISFVLTAGTVCFVVPYIVLAAPAGYLADRYSKRTILMACKVAEIIIMSLGVLAILLGGEDKPLSIWFLFAVVGLMGAQSAILGPAKLGSIPEILKAEKISAANGLVGLTTVAATVVGLITGNYLADVTGPFGQEHWWLSALVLIGTAVIGWLCCFPIAKLAPANPSRRFPWDAGAQTLRDLRTLSANRAMLRVALGIMFFWSLGALAQMNIDRFAAEGGAIQETDKIGLCVSLIIGVGLGSICAGLWSAGRVELGILPLGAGVIAISSLCLFTVQGDLFEPEAGFTAAYNWACGFLFLLGFGAGLFDIPLAAYMQHRSPPESRGSILAASNCLTFTGIGIMAVLFGILKSPQINFSAPEIFLLCGLFCVPVMLYIVWLIPQASIRFVVWLASKTIYRIRVYDHDKLPIEGGALLIANHVTYLDGVLLLLASSRPIRIIAFGRTFKRRWLNGLAKLFGVIMINPSPKSVARALKTATTAIHNGELVCIFPEGGITHTGNLQEFKPGMMKIIQGTDVPVIPAYLDQLWGSLFSYEGGKFFWKMPRKWPYPVSIHFGDALHDLQDIAVARQAIVDLGTQAIQKRVGK